MCDLWVNSEGMKLNAVLTVILELCQSCLCSVSVFITSADVLVSPGYVHIRCSPSWGSGASINGATKPMKKRIKGGDAGHSIIQGPAPPPSVQTGLAVVISQLHLGIGRGM